MYQSLSSSLRRLDAEERLSLIASIAEEVCLSRPLRDADYPARPEYDGMLVSGWHNPPFRRVARRHQVDREGTPLRLCIAVAHRADEQEAALAGKLVCGAASIGFGDDRKRGRENIDEEMPRL
jgi:hypothetical protein